MLGRTYLNLKSTLHLVHSETVTMVTFVQTIAALNGTEN